MWREKQSYIGADWLDLEVLMASYVGRMIGAAKLDLGTYEEVEADRSATSQAMGVVVLSSIAQGIGNLAYGPRGLLAGLASALIGWVVWAFLSYIIGTRLLPEVETKSNIGELLRTTGFASSPGILRILGIIPVIGQPLVFLILIWMLVAMVVAVRQALDYRSTGRAVAVCMIGFAVCLIVFAIFGML